MCGLWSLLILVNITDDKITISLMTVSVSGDSITRFYFRYSNRIHMLVGDSFSAGDFPDLVSEDSVLVLQTVNVLDYRHLC